MRWRHRLWLVVAGFTAGTLAGCLSSTAHRDNLAPAPLPTFPSESASEPATLSPYHAHAVDPARRPLPPAQPPDPAVDLAIRPVGGRPPDGPTPAPPAATTVPTAAPVQPHPETPVVAALRSLTENHPQEALDLLQRLDRPNQELLCKLLPLAARLGEGGADPANAEDVAELLDRLNVAAAALRPRMPLVLENVCFCRRIEGFGVYQPLIKPKYQAGTDGRPGERVQVYVEVRNFTSSKHGGVYVTDLATNLEIRDSQGHFVLPIRCPACLDRSLTRRQDYYINLQFNVPSKLPLGDYTLWVQVRDDGAPAGSPPRAARKSLDFTVTE
jgi:hypothetical protein